MKRIRVVRRTVSPPRRPGLARLLRTLLSVREVQTVLVPRNCVDGFGAAFWARPEAYLDPVVRAGTSWMAAYDVGYRLAVAEVPGA
jgi:hypothetical protein